MLTSSELIQNWEHLEDRAIEAVRSAGRDPAKCKIIAVTKGQSAPAIQILIDYLNSQGRDLIIGESYWQEVQVKLRELKGNFSLHFIGHLQTNKVKASLGSFSMLQTLDSLKLARFLNEALLEKKQSLPVLVQVNVSKDSQKYGVTPEGVKDFLLGLVTYSQIQVRGLMTITEHYDDLAKASMDYRHLREMAEALQKQGLFKAGQASELSMGMSGDFEAALCEGATMIRLGTALFGERSGC